MIVKFGINFDWVMNLYYNIEIEVKGNLCFYVDNEIVRFLKVWLYNVNYNII